jgi:hypothetical protein
MITDMMVAIAHREAGSLEEVHKENIKLKKQN